MVRTTSTHEITEGLPIQKNQCRRQKQIQKLRKLKKLTKKQDSLLKKLLMFKNGYQVIKISLFLSFILIIFCFPRTENYLQNLWIHSKVTSYSRKS